MDKPYSPSCDRNRDPILAALRTFFAPCKRVLEIGSGTGQHAVYFAKELPHLQWQTSDVEQNIPGINAWLSEAGLSNTPPPITLDVDAAWPTLEFDGLFSANTLHIMSWPQVQTMFAKVPSILSNGARIALYGPFNYNGRFTSESNAAFNDWLRDRNQNSAIRDFEAVVELANTMGLELRDDVPMPANNRLLLFHNSRNRAP